MQCGVCGAALPMVRMPANRRQLLWGGWTCPSCLRELDRTGQPVEVRIALPDRVIYTIGPPRSALGGGLAGLVRFLVLLVRGSSRRLQVGLHALELEARRIPYTDIRSVQPTPQGLSITLDGEVVEVPAPPEVHADLVDALLRFRSNQQTGEPVDPDHAAALARLVDRS
ncbi:MAG: hypothetical protein R3F61_17895 [Myxococcota bacterium]